MSLNFVSTSVLSSTDGVSHDTETQLQPTSSSSVTTHQKPLFEQLRENAEKEQEKYDEITKAMRGTTTLDEDDVAFIQGIEDQKEEMKNDVRRKEEEELQMFRAARLEKTMMKSELVEVGEEFIDATSSQEEKKLQQDATSSRTGSGISSLLGIKPTIIKKRRRRVAIQTDNRKSSVSKRLKDSDENNGENVEEKIRNEESSVKKDDTETKEAGGLSGLLAYGSDSDSD